MLSQLLRRRTAAGNQHVIVEQNIVLRGIGESCVGFRISTTLDTNRDVPMLSVQRIASTITFVHFSV